jgi:hypothetical protein
MVSPQAAFSSSARSHAHVNGECCPYCDQPIPNAKAAEIRARVAAEERKRTEALTTQLASQFAQERLKLQAQAREEGKKAAEVAAQEKIKQATSASAAANEKLTLAERQKNEVLTQYNALKLAHDAEVNKRVAEVRDAMEKAKAAAVSAEIAKQFGERQKLTTMVQDLQRRLEKQTADQLGEGAEIDLLDALKDEFPNDNIERIGKGLPGADIKHIVLHNGKQAGIILYDSKNRNAWRNDFVEKLARDQRAARADHAILATLKFPAETRQIHTQDGVIVANPARVVALTQILRQHIVHAHTLRLSGAERTGKTIKLYDFIVSKRCMHLFDAIDTHAEDLLDLQDKEKRAHEATWKRQGQLTRSIQKVRADIGAEIDQIIGSD